MLHSTCSRFSTVVRDVVFHPDTDDFTVTVKDLRTDEVNLNNPPILRFKYFWIWFRIGRPIYNLITSLEGVECSFTLINGYTV